MILYICTAFRDVAQPGSVLVWGTRGRWFESSHPDFFKSKIPFTLGKWDLFFFMKRLLLHHINVSVMIT